MPGTRTAGLPDCGPLLADPDDLTLVFQPIVDLDAGTVVGFEALSRGPAGDLHTPDRLFAAARSAGRLAELDTEDGFILDGFPRNIEQAVVLAQILGESGHSLDAVV